MENEQHITNITANPKPEAVFIFLETAKYEHIPRKNAKIAFSTNIDFTKIPKRFSIFKIKLRDVGQFFISTPLPPNIPTD